ncbi:MAG: glycerol kinase [Flavobacteriia bacterium]|nr:MAG: glycerol kinase [Flavobacteriia bacterium]
MSEKYIIAIDQGTTSSRSVLFDNKARILNISHIETRQIYPENGWVEQDPVEIYKTQLKTLTSVIDENKISADKIAAIGITNQRETTIVWNKRTGKPVYNAIVWQDLRTSEYCKKLQSEAWDKRIKQKTGLVIDSYFSATKIKWILDHIKGARDLAKKGELLFGTIDTWILWNLTHGEVHATDYSNASRTMLFNIRTLEWDKELLELFDIPLEMLPEVKESGAHFGYFEMDGVKIPITGIAGDQQAALFGQACFEKGETKNTYGTGCFLLMNTGKKPQFSDNGMLTTIAWGLNGKVYYALEGSVFIGGAAVQWLRDGLRIIDTAEETEQNAIDVKDNYAVIVVPAFSGLGAPYWDMDARGAIYGITRGTTTKHLIKATLESIAYQSMDLINAMQVDSKIRLKSLKVDGGASANNYLMQFQADILNKTVERAEIIESTALGAAYLAGLGIGLWNKKDILNHRKIDTIFEPEMEEEKRKSLIKKWHKAIERTKGWED